MYQRITSLGNDRSAFSDMRPANDQRRKMESSRIFIVCLTSKPMSNSNASLQINATIYWDWW